MDCFSKNIIVFNMKKILLITTGLFYSIVAFAQDIRSNEVPSLVLNSFHKTFPKALEEEWEFKNNLYKVEFEIDRNDHEAWLDNEGNIMKQKQDMQAKELPKAVSGTIKTNYKGYRIDDVEKIITGTKTVYKVELKKGLNEQDVFFDPSGKVVEGSLK